MALPSMEDHRFHKTVVLICGHDDKGALGLIINRGLASLTFNELLDNLHIRSNADYELTKVHFGGYVEMGRGFIIHTPDYHTATTVHITDDLCLTATTDIINAIVNGEGPEHLFLTLGYAGWSAQQLEKEIIHNGWLVLDSSPELIFHTDLDLRWQRALTQVGISTDMISLEGGTA